MRITRGILEDAIREAMISGADLGASAAIDVMFDEMWRAEVVHRKKILDRALTRMDEMLKECFAGLVGEDDEEVGQWES